MGVHDPAYIGWVGDGEARVMDWVRVTVALAFACSVRVRVLHDSSDMAKGTVH